MSNTSSFDSQLRQATKDAKCALCGNPAKYVDSMFPYMAENNRCRECKEKEDSNV